MSKHYTNGVILGRFQPFHLGHASVLENALEHADKVLLLIGSSQESRTKRNPFSYEERKTMVESSFKERVIVAPLPDLGIGDVCGWGEYVISSAEKALGEPVGCFFLGSEDKNGKWFTPDRKKTIGLVELDRTHIDISATKVREFLLNGDEESFKRFTRPEIHSLYPKLREILLSIE